ncbi:MAG: phosphopyruvate hydratase [Candidatus Buchananbacteria bacterium]|nr:phosphopyruvate hydratase [Candidatus Buchananbacteria bacterium]
MLNPRKIKNIKAREILDSRGNPTVEVKVYLKNGLCTKASVPSGASTGKHEALELRDKNKKRYLGKGVLKAVKNVNNEINYLLKNLDVSKQQDIDKLMIKLDDTDNKSKLGANAILGVSLACARAGAKSMALPLYRYLRRTYKIHYKSYKMPLPMMNILNGGKHANWALDIQEAMIVPKAGKMSKRVQMGSEVFHHLGELLKKKKMNTFVGDEGGYAVNLKKNEEAFKLILAAIKKAGYKPYKNIDLAIDAAASEFFNKSKQQYKINSKQLKSGKLIDLYKEWVKKYKLALIEDGLAEDDWDNWQVLTEKLSDKCILIGDDLFVTNTKRLQKGIDMNVANAILIKLNQIGSLTETIATIYLAKMNGYKVIISHRSGETCDNFIADLAVAVNADYIKTGSLSRSERISKYNRLMEIEEELS